MTAPFASREITVIITLAQGTFKGTENSNTVKLTGHRTAAHIVKAGGVDMSSAQVQIYGLDLSVMNQLSTLGQTPTKTDTGNQITIQAGDAGQQPSTVFVGTIYEAIVDLSDAPNGILHITSRSGLGDAITTVPASSFQGAVDAAQILKGMAGQSLTPGGLGFENNNVSVMLSNPYYPGSLRSQMQKVCTAAGINWIIDNAILAIWPAGGFRSSQQNVPTISVATGMEGYPFPSGEGLMGVRMQFNNQISYGCSVNVQSIITSANQQWVVRFIEHDIAALMPDGPWRTTIKGSRIGQGAP